MKIYVELVHHFPKADCPGELIDGGCYSAHGQSSTDRKTWDDADADCTSRAAVLADYSAGHLVWLETTDKWNSLAREFCLFLFFNFLAKLNITSLIQFCLTSFTVPVSSKVTVASDPWRAHAHIILNRELY